MVDAALAARAEAVGLERKVSRKGTARWHTADIELAWVHWHGLHQAYVFGDPHAFYAWDEVEAYNPGQPKPQVLAVGSEEKCLLVCVDFLEQKVRQAQAHWPKSWRR